jgi:hypothetical protein
MFAVPNLGSIDRLIRLVIGTILIAVPFLTEMVPAEAVAIGAIIVFTAFMRCCPLYRLFGASTCKLD